MTHIIYQKRQHLRIGLPDGLSLTLPAYRNRVFKKRLSLHERPYLQNLFNLQRLIYTAFVLLILAWAGSSLFQPRSTSALAHLSSDVAADDAQISIFVWHDQNRNGLQDETPIIGLNNVTIRLFRAGDSPTLIAMGVTDDNEQGHPGYTLFNVLPAGTYFAQFDLETLPLGYQVTTANIGDDDRIDSDTDPMTGATLPIDIQPTDPQNNTLALGLTRLPDLVLTQTDGGAAAAAGTTIRYTLAFDNIGDFDAKEVIISAIVPQNSRFAQADSSPGWECEDNAPTNTPCTFHIGQVVQGGTGSVVFAVQVDSTLPADILQIKSSSFISIHGGDEEVLLTNNSGKDITPIGILDKPSGTVVPTAIELLSFVSLPQYRSISVEWRTGAEVNTFGYHLYRNTSNQRGGAVLVTEEVIPARGDTGGYYSFTDLSVTPGVPYTYWLVEFESRETSHEYGPIRSTIQAANPKGHMIFLPLVNR